MKGLYSVLTWFNMFHTIRAYKVEKRKVRLAKERERKVKAGKRESLLRFQCSTLPLKTTRSRGLTLSGSSDFSAKM
jgi:hypothetical protein